MMLLRYSFLILTVFSLVYPVVWNFFPITITRVIQLAGVYYFFKYIVSSYDIVSKTLKESCKIFLLIAIFSIIRIICSGQFEFSFVKFVSNYIMCAFSAAFIFLVFPKLKLDYVRIIDIILICACLQALVSLAMFVNPALFETVMSHVDLNEGDSQRTALIEYRMLGLGNSFWTSGANYGVDLILLSALPYIGDSLIYRKKVLYWCLVVLIVIAGALSARTFFLSIPLSLLLLSIMNNNIIKLFWGFLRTGVILGVIFYFTLPYLSSLFDTSRLENILNWSFELFFNYADGQGLESGSTDTMKSMYLFPDSLSTWIIGDGFYTMPNGSYYKSSDIGIVRQLFFYGIVGLSVYWYSVVKVYKKTIKVFNDKIMKVLLSILLLFSIILSFKGMIDLSVYITLIVMGKYFDNSQIVKIK